MRRLVILALLYLGMQLVLLFRGVDPEAPALLTFGFLILAAYTVGELGASFRLPKIVGYMLAGFAFGPGALGTLSDAVAESLSPISSLAIALIAFLAGAELQWKEVKEHGGTIMRIMSAELIISFIGIVAVLLALHEFLPALAGASTREVIAFSVLFGSVAIIHSPAVTLALLSETGARGAVARTTLGIVLVADVAVVLLFSGALAFARAIIPPAAGGVVGFGSVVWEILGAFIVGALLGGAVALYMRFVKGELFIFAILIAFLGAEIARLAHVETLLTLLIAGFVTENFSGGRGEPLRHAMERAADPVFVVFFALAGAGLRPDAVVALWPLVLPLVAVRALGIAGGSWLGARWAGASTGETRYVWMGLISQAGVAIGLATVLAEVYPTRGDQLRTLFLAVLAINQTVGPILFRHALYRSGEVPETPAAPGTVAAAAQPAR